MKTLYLIRHGKSSWKDNTLDDFDRPLNKRGKKDAPFMGELLDQVGTMPDVIYSSPAKRTKVTAKIIAKKIGYEKEIKFDKRIYEFNFVTLVNVIKQINDHYASAFLFGHNPVLNLFAEEYCDLYENIPTCGILKMVFDCDTWEDILASNCELLDFDFPKKHRNQ